MKLDDFVLVVYPLTILVFWFIDMSILYEEHQWNELEQTSACTFNVNCFIRVHVDDFLNVHPANIHTTFIIFEVACDKETIGMVLYIQGHNILTYT